MSALSLTKTEVYCQSAPTNTSVLKIDRFSYQVDDHCTLTRIGWVSLRLDVHPYVPADDVPRTRNTGRSISGSQACCKVTVVV
jgi:hypothetical protein